MTSLSSVWYKPRAMVRYLDQFAWSQLSILGILIFCYSIQISTFVLSIEEIWKINFAPIMNFKGVVLIVYLLLLLGIGLFTVIQAMTMCIWTFANSLNGQGTIPQTRLAISWSLFWSIPLGLFLLLIY